MNRFREVDYEAPSGRRERAAELLAMLRRILARTDRSRDLDAETAIEHALSREYNFGAQDEAGRRR